MSFPHTDLCWDKHTHRINGVRESHLASYGTGFRNFCLTSRGMTFALTFFNLLLITSLVCFCFWRDSPPVGHGLLIHEVSRSHTTMHHIRQDSSGRVISSSQRPHPDNTQQSQQTDIHIPGGIRTHNLSRRAAVDLSL